MSRITSRKAVSKAAEAVWAANKYFVLACSQSAYRDIRHHLRPNERDVNAAFLRLKEIDRTYRGVHSADLPELSNALYHLLGYFKSDLLTEERQYLQTRVKEDPEEVLEKLETYTFAYDKTYLKSCRLWQRDRSFSLVPVGLKIEGELSEAYVWDWQGDYICDDN
ncbi:DUF1722 domain-containing protein [Geomicrobium sp. JSM 1781026]|uniref:DUF1722 domain-containing protein n=1 Tax=Geomicrobium sp. JSM 1781026 TaxID=3344580 RepID=UPI0035C0D8D7